MTFGPQHYVPVLKVKRAEKRALRSLALATQQKITPLLEIVERKPDTMVEAHLSTAFRDFAASVEPYARCFLDTREISADGPAVAEQVFQRASEAGMAFAPVTGISRTSDVSAALRYRQHGLALRLTRQELEDGRITSEIQRFLSLHHLSPEELDLFIDLGAVDDMVTDGIVSLTNAFLAGVPDHIRWRTFTVSGCAFPGSMGGVARNSHDFVERAEWNAWFQNCFMRRRSLVRVPTFSDCAIQHPKGVEGFDPRTMQVSAAIRYTRADDWLLIKGESTRNIPPSTQFPALARQLTLGDLHRYFAGDDHCGGCASMLAAANGSPRLGSAEAWRRLGTIHHITAVTEQLEALPWS